MKVVTAQEFEAASGKYLRLARKEDVIVTRNGKAAARLTAISQEDFEEYVFETDPRFIAYMKRSQREHEKNCDSIPLEEVCRRLHLPLPGAKPGRTKGRERAGPRR